MIRSKRGLMTVSVVTLIIGLVILLPARVMYRWLAPPEFLLSGISGSVWFGDAREASVDGLYLRNIRWSIKPLQLITGNLTYRVVGSPVSGFVESDVSTSFGGAIKLSSLSASLPLALFAAASGIRGLQGNASLKFERIEILDGLPVAADGTFEVANLLIPRAGRESLGGYKADFFTDSDGVTASIEDTDGVLDLAGRLDINHDRSFAFLGPAIVTPKTPTSVREQLQLFWPANNRGQHELRLEGTL